MADPAKPTTPAPSPPPNTAQPKPAHTDTKSSSPKEKGGYAARSKEGQHLAMKHAQEERIKELELQLETEKKRQEAINKISTTDLNGELGHGEEGWIALDNLGSPTGVAMEELPAPGEWESIAPVVGYFPVELDTLVTPSGAPITPFMNPMPDPRGEDAGMMARNKDGYKSDYNVQNREEWQMGKPGTAQSVNQKPAHNP